MMISLTYEKMDEHDILLEELSTAIKSVSTIQYIINQCFIISNCNIQLSLL